MIEIVTVTMSLYKRRRDDAPLKCDACGFLFENGENTYKILWCETTHGWGTKYYQRLVCKDPLPCYATYLDKYLWVSKTSEG
jgi:hypothetical protein